MKFAFLNRSSNYSYVFYRIKKESDSPPLSKERGFRIGEVYEWEAVMENNPSYFQGVQSDLKRPVDTVSWEDCQLFCKKTGTHLPHEKLWELACRAGTTTRFNYGGSYTQLSKYGWFDYNSEGQTHPVGMKLPNAWGLHDMHGNVFEWCENKVSPNSDLRVFRGGSFLCMAIGLHASVRDSYPANSSLMDLGFRVCRPV